MAVLGKRTVLRKKRKVYAVSLGLMGGPGREALGASQPEARILWLLWSGCRCESFTAILSDLTQACGVQLLLSSMQSLVVDEKAEMLIMCDHLKGSYHCCQ